jgi:hypothetical protein
METIKEEPKLNQQLTIFLKEIPIIRIYQDSDREKQAELTNYSKGYKF